MVGNGYVGGWVVIVGRGNHTTDLTVATGSTLSLHQTKPDLVKTTFYTYILYRIYYA